ncbi:MAG: hypothetical protein JHC57_06640 [Sphingopyxis sp.]|uniref:hypothetical protein n=1 Tax=Sphingopyxis sp. TaxID=1908224 RepID=UPI001A1C3F1F|nr:hypothetical protein [Sphingopyxis sp.]MBJ7499412.1 hypothetical protein [Sphingopyxis sp.]
MSIVDTKHIPLIGNLAEVAREGINIGIYLVPPALTRLEPQSISGDPAPGLEMAVHDPLWMLGRQWQFAEFSGEDAGTPLTVQVKARAKRVSAWKPSGAGSAVPLAPGALLDQAVEREPREAAPALRARAEAAGLLVAMLAEVGLDIGPVLRATYPFTLPATEIGAATRLIAARNPDGEAIAAAIEANDTPWLGGAPAAVRDAAAAWLDWYRTQISPLATSESWLPQHLEYRFAIRAGSGDAQASFEAPMHEGGAIDWYSFDASGTPIALPGEAAESDEEIDLTSFASPLRYSGMPADRLWQFEDSAANFGAMEVQPNDLARLCLIEFAMVYGCDWFLTPLDIPAGAFTELGSVTLRDSFGETESLTRSADGAGDTRFRLFRNSRGDDALDGLLVPPASLDVHEGRPVEQVNFLRDEMANMGWAVERVVPDAGGDPRLRMSRALTGPERAEGTEVADLTYRLMTGVPDNWIPLVPVPTTGRGGFKLRKGTMTGTEQAKGRILAATPFDLMDEELPRAGLKVMRVPSLTRDAKGNRIRWIARRIESGFGEGSSGLKFDDAHA